MPHARPYILLDCQQTSALQLQACVTIICLPTRRVRLMRVRETDALTDLRLVWCVSMCDAAWRLLTCGQ